MNSDAPLDLADARRAALVAMAKAAQAETYDGAMVSLPSYELLALLRDLAAAEARGERADYWQSRCQALEGLQDIVARVECERDVQRVDNMHLIETNMKLVAERDEWKRVHDMACEQRDNEQSFWQKYDAAQVIAERDAARGDIAALTDAVNGWCREVGAAAESPNADMPNVREALNRVGYRANAFRIERDAARAKYEQAVRVNDQLVSTDDVLKAENAHLRTRVAAAIALAEDPYGDAVQAMAGDEPLAVGRKIAAAIRAVVVRDEEKA